MVKSIVSNGSLLNNNAFIGPSLCCNVPGFEFSDLINAGWLKENVDRLSAVTVQHYPTNNCKVNGKVIEPQDIFSDFLNHTSAQALVGEYLADSVTVQNAGKELVMLETNTASCGGFAGVSDSFGAAMWCVLMDIKIRKLLIEYQVDRFCPSNGVCQLFYRLNARRRSKCLLQRKLFPTLLQSEYLSLFIPEKALHSSPFQAFQDPPMDSRIRLLPYPRHFRSIWQIQRFSGRGSHPITRVRRQ